jgi:hypothetical protein
MPGIFICAYNNIIFTYMQNMVIPARKTKGRNPHLVSKRNDRIIIRYYFWREVERRRTDDVIGILSNDEFFLHEHTIRRIIRQHLDKFSILKKEKPSPKALDKYTFINLPTQQSLWLD